MVTRIHKHLRPRLFLKEHREAKGVSAAAMAGRLEVQRESIYRLERESHCVNAEKQIAYALALGIEPEDLWHPPGKTSIDTMIKDAPEEVQEMAADIIRRLLAGRR